MTVLEGSCFLVCEDVDGIVGYVVVARFPGMDEMAELWVAPSHAGRGVSRGLLERCWPNSPSPELGRLVVAVGRPADLTLFTEFGVMPVSGPLAHAPPGGPLPGEPRPGGGLDRARRARATPDRAVEEWSRLEPAAIAHDRTPLHEFFGRTRNCLATVDDAGNATALCWVSGHGEIGPGVGQNPEDLSRWCSPRSTGWRRCRSRRASGCTHHGSLVADGPPPATRIPGPLAGVDDVSVPLPGLDRYLATRPVRLL